MGTKTTLEEVEFSTMTLEQIKLQVQTYISQTVIGSMKVEDISKRAAQNIAGELLIRLRASVPGREDRTVLGSVTVPATWWDAVKERWTPWMGWKRRIIATETKIYHVCPHVELPKTDERHWTFLTGSAEYKP